MTKKAKRVRRSFTADRKAAIVRRHLADKVPVSDLCEEYKIQPSLFYQWQRQVFENLESVLAPSGKQKASAETKLQARIAELEGRLGKKDEVIAEVAAEMVKLKKELGEL